MESRLSPVANIDVATTAAGGVVSEAIGAIPIELRLGKMHLVDLAGSERLALSQAEGETLVETQNINLSLTALGAAPLYAASF